MARSTMTDSSALHHCWVHATIISFTHHAFVSSEQMSKQWRQLDIEAKLQMSINRGMDKDDVIHTHMYAYIQWNIT